MPIFDDFWALLNFFYFPASRLYLALVVVGTLDSKQRLFISANFWWLLAQFKVVLFFGGNVVLRHCWGLVQQRRKECCSTVPTFDDFRHCLTIFFFSETVLCFSTVEGYNSAKKTCSTVPIFDAFRHCWAFFVFRWQCCTSALLMASTSVPKKCYSTMPAFDGQYYSAETKVVH